MVPDRELTVPDDLETAPPAPWSPDVGDEVWAVYWRAFPMGGNPNNGSWEVAAGRVVALSKAGVVCHEVANAGVCATDGGYAGTLLRWTPAGRIHQTFDAARDACRGRPAP